MKNLRRKVTRHEYDGLYRELDSWLVIFIEAGVLEDQWKLSDVQQPQKRRLWKTEQRIRLSAEKNIERLRGQLKLCFLDPYELLSVKKTDSYETIERRYMFLMNESEMLRTGHTLQIEGILNMDRKSESQQMIDLLKATHRESYHLDLQSRYTEALESIHKEKAT